MKLRIKIEKEIIKEGSSYPSYEELYTQLVEEEMLDIEGVIAVVNNLKNKD